MQWPSEKRRESELTCTDYERDKRNFAIILAVLLIVTLTLFFVSMCVGRYSVSLKDVAGFFIGQEIPDVSWRVLSYLRLPRTLLAMLVGCALSVSGAVFQSAFNNKLVSPDFLGVSSGASVGACFAILLGFSNVLVSLLAFAAGCASVGLTVFVARIFRSRSTVVLLLAGMAVGGLMSSDVGLMKYLADNEMKLAEMTYWLLGDLSGVTMRDVRVMAAIAIVNCAVLILLSWRLNIISLGARESKSLGIRYKANMLAFILAATLLTAGAVSVSGTIGWIGLAVPNVMRLIAGSDNRKLLPATMMCGAAFMLAVDTIARSISPNEIPLSVITGIIGTPLFVCAIFKKRKELG